MSEVSEPVPSADNRNRSSRNAAVLAEFVAFCEQNPELRFWQALALWSGASRIEYVSEQVEGKDWPHSSVVKEERCDTWNWEGKDG